MILFGRRTVVIAVLLLVPALLAIGCGDAANTDGADAEDSSKGWVVWVDSLSNEVDAQVHAYDLASGEERPVCTSDGSQSDPAVSGEWVVWVDWSDGDSDASDYPSSQIYALNLKTGEEQLISE